MRIPAGRWPAVARSAAAEVSWCHGHAAAVFRCHSVGLFTLALSACGQRALGTGRPGRGGGGGGAHRSARNRRRGGSRRAAAGAGGSASVEPPADIAGRWGMFGFEDPVGVLLNEAADGTLTAEDAPRVLPELDGSTACLIAQFCGDISGKVTGHTARFRFPLSAQLCVYSARGDRSRVMAAEWQARSITGPAPAFGRPGCVSPTMPGYGCRKRRPTATMRSPAPTT